MLKLYHVPLRTVASLRNHQASAAQIPWKDDVIFLILLLVLMKEMVIWMTLVKEIVMNMLMLMAVVTVMVNHQW